MQAIVPLTGIYNCSVFDYFYETDEASFKVKIDGQDVSTSRITTASPVKDFCEPVKWGTFQVTFPVEQDVFVEVSYSMWHGRHESWETFNYTLNTGAAWYGNIGRAEVVVRLPYTITPDNVRMSPGYVVKDKEIRWSWNNLEPTRKDDLFIQIVPPKLWERIILYETVVKLHPKSADSWSELAAAYAQASTFHVWKIINWSFARYSSDAYKKALALQPDSMKLHLDYAHLLLAMSLTGNNNLIEIGYPSVQLVVRQIDAVLAIDPDNQDAKSLLDFVKLFTNTED